MRALYAFERARLDQLREHEIREASSRYERQEVARAESYAARCGAYQARIVQLEQENALLCGRLHDALCAIQRLHAERETIAIPRRGVSKEIAASARAGRMAS